MSSQPRRTKRSTPTGSDPQWVAAQFVLLGVIAVGGIIEYLVAGRGFSIGPAIASILLGLALMVISVGVLARAAYDLADNLTAYPTPVEGAELVDRGIYGIVRHPMYLSLLLGSAGYSILLGSWIALLTTVALFPFFTGKARREERLLRQHVPGYDAYTHRVGKRFIPWVV